MWSASGLLGSRPASQVRRMWQMGQCSSPAARAERLAAAALWSQRVVPVREVVTCPPRTRVRRPAPWLLCSRRWPRFSPFPSPQKGRQQWSPATVWVGWALTLCLCSYDARFRVGAQVVVMPGVLRFGHRAGACLLWGAPIVDTPSPCIDAPSPSLMGCPCFARGWSVYCSPPLFVWPTPLFVCAPRACLPSVCGHTLKSSGTNPIHQLHREEEP
jgi:hypothetical protein|nr:MAG TPA: hypothetical protein [Caudoviricetes sp.]